MPIKLGAPVRQNVKPIEGVVIKRQFNESRDQMEYLVESPDSDGDGVPQTRWFAESDIEATGEPAADFKVAEADPTEDTARVIDAGVKAALGTQGE